MARCHSALLVSLLSASMIAACGGGSPAPPSSGGESGEGGGQGTPGQIVELRGGERLAWDQAADSSQALSSFTFRLFVDGAPAALTAVRCTNVPSASGYPCSGLLPPMSVGQHSLELTAASNGLQSGTSAPLVVRVVASSSSSVGVIAASSATASATFSNPPICVTPTPDDYCHRVQVLAAGLGPVSSVVSTPDGRVFFIEYARHIRAIQDGVLLAEPALSTDRARARLISLTVPPDFDRTHVVFVAWALTIAGSERLQVTRYREAHGALGEGATIVTGLPIPEAAEAPMAVDDQGLLYLALPVGASRVETGGVVVRFDASGAVPATNPMYSPVVGTGSAHPSAMAWDAVGRQMWLAGSGSEWPDRVLTLPISTEGRAGQSVAPLLQFPPEAQSSSMAWTHLVTDTANLWLLSTTGAVFRGPLQSRAALVFTQLDFDALGRVSAIGKSASGDLLIATETSASDGGSGIWLVASGASSGPLP